MTVRTRFAPSPTGYLHIGGVRTALYNWLFAKREGGQFILRIEDTDTERSTQESIDAILEGMQWLGLNYDEGPFYQTQRFDRYKELIQQLLDEGKAYRCYCSKERLEQVREAQKVNKEKPRYDGCCRELKKHPKDEPFVIRFKNPQTGAVIFEDLVRSKVTVNNKELDDLIIARTDGTPTYNFVVVVDDIDMKITHVIRGDDHLNNTPRQINILQALGAPLPIYAHLPMILGADGKRLSKRHGAVSVMQYRQDGFLPHALLNYLVRLGWSYGDQEVFSAEQMIKLFDVHSLNKSGAVFDNEKLLWLNQHYIKHDPAETLLPELQWQFQQAGIEVKAQPPLEKVLAAQRERCKTLKEMMEKSKIFYQDKVVYDEEALAKHLNNDSLVVLEYLQSGFKPLKPWDREGIAEIIDEAAEELELKKGQVAQPLRVAMTGNTISPSIDVTLELLGKERVMNQLAIAMKMVSD